MIDTWEGERGEERKGKEMKHSTKEERQKQRKGLSTSAQDCLVMTYNERDEDERDDTHSRYALLHEGLSLVHGHVWEGQFELTVPKDFDPLVEKRAKCKQHTHHTSQRKQETNHEIKILHQNRNRRKRKKAQRKEEDKQQKWKRIGNGNQKDKRRKSQQIKRRSSMTRQPR